MKYTLTVKKYDRECNIIYDSRMNSLTKEDGIIISVNKQNNSPKYNSLRINVVLGQQCNYTCKYCCQDSHTTNYLFDKIIDNFVFSLKEYYEKYYSKCNNVHIVYWGGEPLVYYHLMKELHNEMKDAFKNARFGICTNGALLNEENSKWILDNNIGIGLSYDGPGQFIRDKNDILAKGTFSLEFIKYLLTKTKHISFNPVWHKYNNLISRYIECVNEKVETDTWKVGTSGIYTIHGESSLKYAMNEEESINFINDSITLMYTDKLGPFFNTHSKFALDFLCNLNNSEYQRGCSNTPEQNTLNVTLDGNLWGCHNDIGTYKDELNGNRYKGNIQSNIIPLEYKVFKHNKNTRCLDCVLRGVCRGICMITPLRYADINCRLHYSYHFPSLSLAMNILTGGQLINVSLC